MQALLPLSEALGILLNTKFKQVTNINSDKHSLFHAYSSWSYFVRSKLITEGESTDYEIIFNDKQYGIIFILLDNLVEKSSTLKYQHSFQLLCDCFYSGNSVNDFVFGLFLHILKKKPEDESATKLQQYKYSICRFITEFIMEKEFEKESQPKLLIDSNENILDKFGEDKLTKMVEYLWIITRYESVTMDGRRYATLLTSASSDLVLILGYFLSQNQNEILFTLFDTYFKLIGELLHWFENQRDLYTSSLKYLHAKLKEISSIVALVNSMERSSREEDRIRSKEGRNMSLKSFSSYLAIYGFLMVENREYFDHYIRYSTKIEGSATKHDYLFDYLMAILLEIEKTENESEILHNLIYLSTIMGKMKKKELKKYLGIKARGEKETKTLYEIILHITNNKLFKINSDNIARITIYLYKEMVNYSGETNDRGAFVDMVMEMLESDDTVSKAVILFVSDIVSSDKTQIYSIFKLVESENDKAKKNGLLILSEIFNSIDIDEELSHRVTDYLINKLASDDLSIRSCTATVFSKLDFKYISNRIIPLYVSKNEKERSAAHEILTKLMDTNTENPNIFMIVVNSIKDLPILEDPNPDQTRKNIAERVMTFIPKYFANLSPNSSRLLVEEVIDTFFESNTNSLLVFMMNKILNSLLSVDAPLKVLSTEEEYILNNKKDILLSIISKVLEKLKSPMIDDETIFDMLAPLLVLKTLPVSIFYYIHPNEEHDRIFSEVLQLMIRNLIDLSKPEELRRVSAEVASKLPPRITISVFVARFSNYLQKDSLRKAKSTLFCICQTIALYEEDPYLYSFLTGEDSLLVQSIKNAWNLQSNDQELSKIHQGCMDCMVMIIKYMLNYSHSDSTSFISDNVLKPLSNNGESMMVKVSISNIITKCANILPLKHQLSLSSMVIPIYSKVLLLKREPNAETSLFYCSSLQALMNLVYKIKTAIHPYSKSLLEIISKCLSETDSNIRLFSLKLLSSLLFSREDVLIDHKTIFEFEILKKVKGMASIESSIEVQKLASELCKIMGL